MDTDEHRLARHWVHPWFPLASVADKFGAMSVGDALRFIRAVRDDESLRREIRLLGEAPPLERLVAIGARLGCPFTPAELEQAFKQDSALRWVFYSARRGSKPSDSEGEA